MLLALLRALPGDGAPGNLAAVHSTLLPGQMTPLHVHTRPEAVQVVEGAITVHRVGCRAAELYAGDALLLPGGEPHTLRAGSTGARIRSASFVASVARYEDFIRAAATPSGGLSEQDAMVLGAIGAVNGISVTGPPGALPAVAA